jgi:nucleotide-binding universal stress UspA family protein
MYRLILASIDGSETALKAADHAIKLARLTKAKLIILHVIDNRSFLGYDEPEKKNLREHLQKLAKTYIEQVSEISSNLDVEMVVAEGSPAEEIVKVAENRNVELIVMGTRGLTGARRTLLGSTASQVIEWAPCPVLVVR